MSHIAVSHRENHQWLESGRPTKKGVMVHPNQNPDGLRWGKVFMKALMATPNALDVYYEPGFNSLRHSHPMDEIFFMFSGSLHVNGYDLTEGSVAYVPKNTMYGPEYTGDDGAYFIRIELWDTATGRPDGTKGTEMEPSPTLRLWNGPFQINGTPNVNQPDPSFEESARSKQGAIGALAANGKDKPWIEVIEKTSQGTTEGKLFSRQLLSPKPEVVEMWGASGLLRNHNAAEVDKLFCVLDGELTLSGQMLTKGSVGFVPKNTTYDLSYGAPQGAHYIRVVLLDSEAPNPRDGQPPSSGKTRPWTGPLTAKGLPDISP
ncbi:cupin domain-containing protein [Dehalococcoidia bacterium]|nr:cupin domain-containing protein [Dehalococcoidia bacterium]